MLKKTTPSQIQVGDLIPNTNISLKDSEVELRDFFQNRKGIFLGVHGAYEPSSTKVLTCMAAILPKLKDKFAIVAVISVNDPYVLKAWGKRLKLVEQMTFISDVNGSFTNRLGLSGNLQHLGFGKKPRTQMFALVVEECSRVSYVDVGFKDGETMVKNLMNYLDKSRTTLHQSITDQVPVGPIQHHPGWKPLIISAPEKVRCFIPKAPVLKRIKEEHHVPLIDMGSFECVKKISVQNTGSALKIVGLEGRLEYYNQVYYLDSIYYRRNIQNNVQKCDIETQIVFAAEKPSAGLDIHHVNFSFPLKVGGSDQLLSVMPKRESGYPMPPGHYLDVSVSDLYVKEHGIQYHFYQTKNLIQYKLEKELWIAGTEEHGISKRQMLEIEAMLDSKHRNLSTKSIAINVYTAEIELLD